METKNPMVMNSSQIWPPWVMDDIHAKAELGRYRIRGFLPSRKSPTSMT